MDTAVVILNWNGRHWLERFLPTVLEHSAHAARVIVADNGSTDGSVDWLRKEMPAVEVIAMPTNEGFAGGYNKALAQVDTTYFLLLNSDVETTPGWIDALHAHLAARPDMAACQPKVLSHGGRNSFEHAGAAGGFIDRNGYPFCRGRIFEITEEDHGQYNDDRDVFWATGACLMIRAEAFRAAGGFDAELFAHMEEIDLCWCMRRMGWRVGYTSSATVFHVGGGALGYGSPRKTYLNFRNSLAVLTKHLRSHFIVYRIFHRLVLDLFAAMKFIAEGHAEHAWQVGKAHRRFFRWLPRLYRERKRLRKLENSPDLTGMYHRSIAYDRYILGWKKFSDLDIKRIDQPPRRSKYSTASR
ncbi:MAG: glycosyltransferase family 2 protein [Flavobacteriales bacterium]